MGARATFLNVMAGAAVFLAAGMSCAAAQTVAITIDDVPGRTSVGDCDLEATRAMNLAIIDALQRHDAPAVGFVTESTACETMRDNILVDVLSTWLEQGFELGNHTFSHPDLNRIRAQDFITDAIAGERITRDLITKRGGELRYFRYPQLHTGDTRSKKDAVANWLNRHDYTNAPVTLDSQEWLFAAAYRQALARGDLETATCVGEAYIPFMESVVEFFEVWSKEVLGYMPPQVLLLHDNELNADYLPALLDMLEARRYTFVSLSEALSDSAYSQDDGYVGSRGLSWIHRWALQRGMPLRQEPREPDWINSPSRVCPSESD